MEVEQMKAEFMSGLRGERQLCHYDPVLTTEETP